MSLGLRVATEFSQKGIDILVWILGTVMIFELLKKAKWQYDNNPRSITYLITNAQGCNCSLTKWYPDGWKIHKVERKSWHVQKWSRTYKFIDRRASFNEAKFPDGTKCDPTPTYSASEGVAILFPVIPR